MTGRTAVFIDNGYFSKILKMEYSSPRINYVAFSEILCDGNERFRTYVYDSPPYQSTYPTEGERDRASKADSFFAGLRKQPRCEVRLGKLLRVGNPPKFTQKGVDVLLSIDLVKLSSKGTIENAVIITGDSDFVPAIKEAKACGVLVTLVHSSYQHVSNELYEICDDRVVINQDMIDKALMRRY